MITIKAEDFELLEFYSYTTYGRDIISDCTLYPNTEKGYVGTYVIVQLVDDMAKKCQNDIVKRIKSGEETQFIHFDDNKIAFKVRHKNTGTILYFGRKDYHYYISLSVYQEFGYVYDFETHKITKHGES